VRRQALDSSEDTTPDFKRRGREDSKAEERMTEVGARSAEKRI
jgi:hypothetical protein